LVGRRAGFGHKYHDQEHRPSGKWDLDGDGVADAAIVLMQDAGAVELTTMLPPPST
jgi:hypothetical protein